MSSLYDIEAEVRGKVPRGYRIKVSFPAWGVYIDGFTARISDKSESGWWVQPPAQFTGGRWIKPIEFQKSNALWREIEDEILAKIGLAEESDSTKEEIELYEGEITSENLSAIFPD